MIQSYKNIAVECYQLTAQGFPKQEMYSLISQLRRAAVSVPANIAEGKQRHHVNECIQHISITAGSLAKLETHCILTPDT